MNYIIIINTKGVIMIDFIQLILDLARKDKKDRINQVIRHLNGIISPIIQESDEKYLGRITNYIFPAKVSTGKIVISAHYDVVCGYGYNDNASGMAILTQLLKDQVLPPNYEVVFLDYEERGGRGASFYCLNSLPNEIKANLNIDVVGLPGKIFYELYSSNNKHSLNLIHENLNRTYKIPFSDSQIFTSHMIPSVLMLTGQDSHRLVPDIFRAEHGGEFDDNINILSNDTLNLVYDTICDIVRSTTINEEYAIPGENSERKLGKLWEYTQFYNGKIQHFSEIFKKDDKYEFLESYNR